MSVAPLAETGITLDSVGSIICGGDSLQTVFLGSICVWPDPWTDIWNEGNALTWTNVWRDKWSDVPGPPVGPEVMSSGSN